MNHTFKFFAFLMVCLFSLSLSAQQAAADDEFKKPTYKPAKAELKIAKSKFRKRTRLISRVINDFDRQETGGYSYLLTVELTNMDKEPHVVTLDCLELIDEDGVSYPLDSEYDDNRRDVMTTGVEANPKIPVKLVLTYIVPSSDEKKYTLKLKGWK